MEVIMALRINDSEIESLLEQITQITGESPEQALLVSLKERKLRLVTTIEKSQSLHSFLENEIWSQIPPELLGTELTKEEEANILGYDD